MAGQEIVRTDTNAPEQMPGQESEPPCGTTWENTGGRRPQETKKPESAFAYPVTFAGPGPSCFSDIADLPSRHPVRAHPAVTHP